MAKLGYVEGWDGKPIQKSVWDFDEDDLLLFALLCDPVYCPELLWEDPTNTDYGGCYRVRDYQYPLFRAEKNNYIVYACARVTGKTESIKAKAFTHAFKRIMEEMLLTAPELIHLLPLTDAIEDRIRSTRLTREFLDTRGGKTGFTHRPFGVDYIDGTKIKGRIPRLTGVGVKGMHVPDLIIDESQDYPERGWIEVHEVVTKDHTDADGNPDFSYQAYGVHSGVRDTGFARRASEGGFDVVNITAIMRPGWGPAEKKSAKSAYGGTQAPDYRRNILGEPGGAASPFFVTARLYACLDQDRESSYNLNEYVHQELRVEEVDELDLPINEVLDLPQGLTRVHVGADLGLTDSPTEICVFTDTKHGKERRLKLVRRFTLHRFRTRQIRECFYAIGWAYGRALMSVGIDATGLGFPIWQEIEDDETAPQHLLDVSRGYFFNSKVPVGVAEENVTEDSQGNLRDQYGAAVKEEFDPLTGITRYVTYMPMIESSTRYLREFVDKTFLLLPFDTDITKDMLGETQQRVKRVGELRRKPNAYHVLDSMRAMAQAYKATDIEEMLATEKQVPVLDSAFSVTSGGPGGMVRGAA